MSIEKIISILDKLNDVPNIKEESVFKEIIEFNKKSLIQPSSYVLSYMWNNTDAAKFGLVNKKTAAEFMEASEKLNDNP